MLNVHYYHQHVSVFRTFSLLTITNLSHHLIIMIIIIVAITIIQDSNHSYILWILQKKKQLYLHICCSAAKRLKNDEWRRKLKSSAGPVCVQSLHILHACVCSNWAIRFLSPKTAPVTAASSQKKQSKELDCLSPCLLHHTHKQTHAHVCAALKVNDEYPVWMD